MNEPPPPARDGSWKALYRAAIFERDTSAIPARVSEAEQAVLSRGRELFGKQGTLEEKEALEEALYALRAFRNAWAHIEAA
jgi:hypothetical protein